MTSLLATSGPPHPFIQLAVHTLLSIVVELNTLYHSSSFPLLLKLHQERQVQMQATSVGLSTAAVSTNRLALVLWQRLEVQIGMCGTCEWSHSAILSQECAGHRGTVRCLRNRPSGAHSPGATAEGEQIKERKAVETVGDAWDGLDLEIP